MSEALRPFAVRWLLSEQSSDQLTGFGEAVRRRLVERDLGWLASYVRDNRDAGLVYMGYGRVRGEIARGALAEQAQTNVERLVTEAARINEEQGGPVGPFEIGTAEVSAKVANLSGSVSVAINPNKSGRQFQWLHRMNQAVSVAFRVAGFPWTVQEPGRSRSRSKHSLVSPDRIALLRIIHPDEGELDLNGAAQAAIAEAANSELAQRRVSGVTMGRLAVLTDADEAREA